MIEELARHRCTGDDGTPLVVIEYAHIFTVAAGDRTRRYRGAAWLALADGEPVRYLDPATFEVVNSGELLQRADAVSRPAPPRAKAD